MKIMRSYSRRTIWVYNNSGSTIPAYHSVIWATPAQVLEDPTPGPANTKMYVPTVAIGGASPSPIIGFATADIPTATWGEVVTYGRGTVMTSAAIAAIGALLTGTATGHVATRAAETKVFAMALATTAGAAECLAFINCEDRDAFL